MWGGRDVPPPTFLAELYTTEAGEEDDGGEFEEVDPVEVAELVELVEELEVVEEPVEDNEENEPSSPVAPPYSPLTSPESRRSRSPLVRESPPLSPFSSLGVVIRVFDEDGVDLELARRPDEAAYEEEEREEFYTPDAHALFAGMMDERDERMESGMPDDRGVLGRSERRSVRGRARGGRGGRVRGQGRRGRGVGGGRRRREAEVWVVGHPLEEIWVTDDDVPLELREMAMDVVRRRMRTTEERSTSDRSTRERGRTNEEDASEIEDEFEDAFGGSTNFEWSPMETFQIREEIFTPERTGSVASFSSPYDAFRSFWDEGILHMIAEETNRYAHKIPSQHFQAEWYPTNADEILCLFAFWMMLGIVRMPTIKSCFSTNFLLKTEVFRHILTYARYCNLTRALHFIDSDPCYNAEPGTSTNDMASSDRIYFLRPIIEHLNAKFQANYIPSQDICIDESLTLWKGRLNIKQYIRSKAAKFGIKTFELCESATGYLWSFIVYTGKQNDIIQPNSTGLKSTAIVKKLIAPLLNKGYRLFL